MRPAVRFARRACGAIASTFSLITGACERPTELSSPADVPLLPAFLERLAYAVDVSVVAGTLSQRTATATRVAPMPRPTFDAGVSGSLVGADAIALEIGSVDRSVIGRFAPGKVRVTARVRLVNLLRGVTLITPTFPPPPDERQGLLLFAVQTRAVSAPGGVTTASNTVQVTSPSSGIVAPSDDWDGAVTDFMTGGRCVERSATCARFERFEQPLREGERSEWRTIGFDIDPTVRAIRLRVVVAADLLEARL